MILSQKDALRIRDVHSTRTALGGAVYKFQGKSIRIPQSAEMSRDFYPNGKYHKLVQDALIECGDDARTKPDNFDWRGGRVMDFTLDLEDYEEVEQYVVRVLPDEPVVYGRYQLHKARSPQDSPFVRDRTRPIIASSLTIELTRARGMMMLVRAYGGLFTPPLPWQASAANYEGGVANSREFWKNHAFVKAPAIVAPGRLQSRPPKRRQLVR